MRPHLSPSALSRLRPARHPHHGPSPLALLAAGAAAAAVFGVSAGASAATSASGPVSAPGLLAHAAATPVPALTGVVTARPGAGSPLAAAADTGQPATSNSPAVSPAVSPTARPTPAQAAQAAHQAATATAQHQPPVTQQASSAPAAQPQPSRKQYPYEIYDSVTPTAIPGDHVVATYATGPFAVQGSDVASDKAVVWIDTTGTDPHAAALDIEPGDVTPSQAARWVAARMQYDPSGTAILYTMISEWPQVQASVSTLPHWMQAHVRWWIADPTGYPHVVAGANATQWYWGSNYDISTANPGF